MTKHQAILTCPPSLLLWLKVWAAALHDRHYKWANNKHMRVLQRCLGAANHNDFTAAINKIKHVTPTSLLQEMRFRKMVSDWVYSQIFPELVENEMERL